MDRICELFALLVPQQMANFVSFSISPPAPGEVDRPAPGLLPLIGVVIRLGDLIWSLLYGLVHTCIPVPLSGAQQRSLLQVGHASPVLSKSTERVLWDSGVILPS